MLDASGVCGGACAADADADGICDTVDPCVGTYDTCGVCNGDGSSDEGCGCGVVCTPEPSTSPTLEPTLWPTSADEGSRIAYFGSMDGRFYAVKTNRGSLHWSVGLAGKVSSSPTVLSDGSTVFVGAMQDGTGTLFALWTHGGDTVPEADRIRWKTDFLEAAVIGSPVLSADEAWVFVTNAKGVAWKISIATGTKEIPINKTGVAARREAAKRRQTEKI